MMEVYPIPVAVGMPQTRAGKIVVVDDDARIRELLERYLTQAGYTVLVAQDAVALTRILAYEIIDVIVLDLMMPGEDGLSVCRRLHTDRPSSPGIIKSSTITSMIS